MNRQSLVRTVVLLDISDDYENTEHVTQSLSQVAQACRVVFHRHEVIEALSELIQSDLAKAYRLSPYAPAEEITGVPPRHQFDDYSIYFYVTDKGKAEVRRLTAVDHPFDENGEFRRDFCPDQ